MTQPEESLPADSEALEAYEIGSSGLGALSQTAPSELESFWGEGLDFSKLRGEFPQAYDIHEVLRLLGPSPFGRSEVGLIGLLEQIYDRISRFAQETKTQELE